jgi:hypothetical protein
VKVLEARFFPESKKGRASVAVARVVCEGARATVEALDVPTKSVEPFSSDALISRLNLLVASAAPRPYEELTDLRSEFWSFVDVDAEGPSPA